MYECNLTLKCDCLHHNNHQLLFYYRKDKKNLLRPKHEFNAIFVLEVFYFAVKLYMDNWISASGVQTRNPFSHTAYVKITCVKFYLRN